MVKQVTCSLASLQRAAKDKGVVLGRDVTTRVVNEREVAVRADTLEGQLFLSLLICGAIG